MPQTRNTPVRSSTIKRIIETELPDETIESIGARCGYCAGPDGYHSGDAIRKIFNRVWISFDIADLILTRTNLHHLWHTDEELLQACAFLDSITPEQHARLDRNNLLKRESAKRIEDLRLKYGECKKKHIQTPENTYTYKKNGKVYQSCKKCKYARQAEHYRRNAKYYQAAARKRRAA